MQHTEQMSPDAVAEQEKLLGILNEISQWGPDDWFAVRKIAAWKHRRFPRNKMEQELMDQAGQDLTAVITPNAPEISGRPIEMAKQLERVLGPTWHNQLMAFVDRSDRIMKLRPLGLVTDGINTREGVLERYIDGDSTIYSPVDMIGHGDFQFLADKQQEYGLIPEKFPGLSGDQVADAIDRQFRMRIDPTLREKNVDELLTAQHLDLLRFNRMVSEDVSLDDIPNRLMLPHEFWSMRDQLGEHVETAVNAVSEFHSQLRPFDPSTAKGTDNAARGGAILFTRLGEAYSDFMESRAREIRSTDQIPVLRDLSQGMAFALGSDVEDLPGADNLLDAAKSIRENYVFGFRTGPMVEGALLDVARTGDPRLQEAVKKVFGEADFANDPKLEANIADRANRLAFQKMDGDEWRPLNLPPIENLRAVNEYFEGAGKWATHRGMETAWQTGAMGWQMAKETSEYFVNNPAALAAVVGADRAFRFARKGLQNQYHLSESRKILQGIAKHQPEVVGEFRRIASEAAEQALDMKKQGLGIPDSVTKRYEHIHAALTQIKRGIDSNQAVDPTVFKDLALEVKRLLDWSPTSLGQFGDVMAAAAALPTAKFPIALSKQFPYVNIEGPLRGLANVIATGLGSQRFMSRRLQFTLARLTPEVSTRFTDRLSEAILADSAIATEYAGLLRQAQSGSIDEAGVARLEQIQDNAQNLALRQLEKEIGPLDKAYLTRAVEGANMKSSIIERLPISKGEKALLSEEVTTAELIQNLVDGGAKLKVVAELEAVEPKMRLVTMIERAEIMVRNRIKERGLEVDTMIDG
jgi:hypothetical protein